MLRTIIISTFNSYIQCIYIHTYMPTTWSGLPDQVMVSTWILPATQRNRQLSVMSDTVLLPSIDFHDDHTVQAALSTAQTASSSCCTHEIVSLTDFRSSSIPEYCTGSWGVPDSWYIGLCNYDWWMMLLQGRWNLFRSGQAIPDETSRCISLSNNQALVCVNITD